MSLNHYVYARDSHTKIVHMNGHEWWNPVADISAAVTDVAGAVQDVGNAVSNAWNNMPPVEDEIDAIQKSHLAKSKRI